MDPTLEDSKTDCETMPRIDVTSDVVGEKKRKAPDIQKQHDDTPVGNFDYFTDFTQSVEMIEEDLRDYIDVYLKKDIFYAKALSALYQKVKNLKQFTGRNMTEKIYITKSKKLEKLDDAMMQLLDEMGETRWMDS